MTSSVPQEQEQEQEQELAGGRLLAALSNEFVRLFARLYGRGPTKARTGMVEDIVLTRLNDPFTTAEKTLIRLGRFEEVQHMRRIFQQEMRQEFLEIVERLTGCRVTNFISEISTDPDLAVELFIVEPGDRAPAAPGPEAP